MIKKIGLKECDVIVGEFFFVSCRGGEACVKEKRKSKSNLFVAARLDLTVLYVQSGDALDNFHARVLSITYEEQPRRKRARGERRTGGNCRFDSK